MTRARVQVMVCPFDAGRRGWRMGNGPGALLAAGVVEALGEAGTDVRRMDVEPDDDALPTELSTGFAVQRQVAAATEAALAVGAVPLLLAGDCNASLGVVAGLQRHGVEPAFAWADAHADIQTPDSDAFGSLDSHGLAMLTGRAWPAMVGRTGLTPLPDDRVVLIGARAVDPAEQQVLRASAIRGLSRSDVRDRSVRAAAMGALLASGTTGAHLHIDADVLDPGIAPANDYAAADGLLPPDLEAVATDIAARVPLTSLSIASYDPDLDPDRVLAAALIDLIVRVVLLTGDQRLDRAPRYVGMSAGGELSDQDRLPDDA